MKKQKKALHKLSPHVDTLTQGEFDAAIKLTENHIVTETKAKESATRLVRYALSIADKSVSADLIVLISFALNNIEEIIENREHLKV